MIEHSCSSPAFAIISGAIVALYMGFEYWLGRTRKTRAASLVELVGVIIGVVIVRLLTKGRGDGEGV